MKKIMAIIVILMLFLLTNVAFSTAMNKNTIIYVDDDGGADYTNIRDAINAASDGDMIFVYTGIYTEHVLINKTISLIGEDSDATIIRSLELNDIIQVYNTNNVTISGFTIQNTLAYTEYLAGVCIENASDTSIFDNIIIGCYDGVLLKSNHNVITENIIKNNKNGICFGHYRNIPFFVRTAAVGKNNLFFHNSNVISRNEIVFNTDNGIVLTYTKLNNISRNNITENGIGIHLRDCSDNEIISNNFLENKLHAFDMSNNQWNRNYWDDWIGLKSVYLRLIPYIIPGTLFVNVDRDPVTEPNDIDVVDGKLVHYISDDEVVAYLSLFHCKALIVNIGACFSGGFADDIIADSSNSDSSG